MARLALRCASNAHPTTLRAERVKDNGKESKLLSQMQESDIGNP
jgi:hypothetical protein